LLALALQLPSTNLQDLVTYIRAQLLTVPPYVCACINILLSSYISDRFKRRGFVNAFNFGLAIIGFVILETTNTAGARYVGTFFAAAGAFPGIPITIAWNANNIQNSPTKRAVGIALQSSVGSIGGIIGSYMYGSLR
jgi:predicted MFS family arabinose efflux permease